MSKKLSLTRFAPSLLAAALIPVATTVCAAPFFTEIGHSVDNLASTAEARFARIDVDADGLDDLVFTARTNYRWYLFVIGKKADGTLGIKGSQVIPDDGPMARVLAWSHDGDNHILTVAGSLGRVGTVRDYAGWPLVEQRTFPVAENLHGAVVGDVDNNGSDELIVSTDDELVAYSMATGALQWTYTDFGSADLALAQLDADPALEIILGRNPGIVLDGATRAVDWAASDGFLPPLATGPVLAEGGTQWLGIGGYNVFTVSRGSPWSTFWTGNTTLYTGATALADLDGDGIDEILLGDNNSGLVTVIDSGTHMTRFQIPLSAYGTSAIAGADLDGNGTTEIAIAAGSTAQGDPALTIASGLSGQPMWQFIPTTEPFQATALGDVDGDGEIELVAASATFTNYGTIAIFNARSGAEEWRSPIYAGGNADPFNIAVRDIKLVAHRSAPGMDIVLGGSALYHGRISVIDGVTKHSILQIGTANSGPMPSRFVNDVDVVDINGDGVKDYVAATTPAGSGATGALLQAFSGSDGSLLWSSPTMGGGSENISGVFTLEPPAGTLGKVVVAVLSGSLRAYNPTTGLLSWSLAIQNDGAFPVSNGLNGPEIAIFSATGTLSFIDAATRQPLRSFTLPYPLRAATVLDGDAHLILATTGETISLVDGETGAVQAETENLGPFPEFGARISALADGPHRWLIATGSEPALFRFRLELLDTIFASSFE